MSSPSRTGGRAYGSGKIARNLIWFQVHVLHNSTVSIPHHYHYTLNPNPAIQLLYCSITGRHSVSVGSSALENSIQSSRAAFSGLQTQQGLGLLVAGCSEVWVLEPLLVVVEFFGEPKNQDIICTSRREKIEMRKGLSVPTFPFRRAMN